MILTATTTRRSEALEASTFATSTWCDLGGEPYGGVLYNQ